MQPKFIISKSIVLQKYNEVKELCDKVSYSSKTNPIITKILENETNSMFSIHLINELKNVQNKSRVLFLAQAWNDELIKNLLEMKVENFVVDNESDLDTFLNYIKDKENKVTLFLRMGLKENTLKTEKYFVFGMGSNLINKRIKEINNIKLGIHFHRKTQNMAEWNIQYELSQCLNEDTLQKISIINIGGGLPSEYAITNVNVIPSIKKKIKEFKEWIHSYNIQLVIEPGRFIAAPAGKLITKIVGIDSNNIVVNASVYNINSEDF